MVKAYSCLTVGKDICKISILKHFLQNYQYEKTVYVGDGANDLCAALGLTSFDLICPRQGYPLQSLLEEHIVQAKIAPWNDGIELMKCLQY